MKSAENPLPPLFHRYALGTTLFVLVLISIGGLVTSKGVGMAVPDWPTTFGYNMFYFPIEKWTGGIFHEHLHRLVASGAGFLTIGLVAGTYLSKKLQSFRALAWVALGLVIFQGVLGGLRVVLDQHIVGTLTAGLLFGLAHATLAQVYFSLMAFIALRSSGLWARGGTGVLPGWVKNGFLLGSLLIFLQLIIAATMRHQHAGLAIPDFPLAYGQIYPDTGADALLRINQRRTDFLHDASVTAFQIHLQMAHRMMAVFIVVWVSALVWRIWRSGATLPGWTRRAGCAWFSLLLVQFCLGAATIWTNKAADIATAHVAVGALSLMTGVLASAMACRSRTSDLHPEISQEFACPDSKGILNNPAPSPTVR